MSTGVQTGQYVDVPAKNFIITRKTKDEVIRTMGRRIPCLTMVFINFTIFAFFVMAILCLFLLCLHYRLRLAVFDIEESLLQNKSVFQSFSMCPYQDDYTFFNRNVSLTYNMDYCMRGCGTMAFAFRIRKVNESAPLIKKNKDKKICFMQHEMVMCRNDSAEIKPEISGCNTPTNIEACAGFNSVKIPSGEIMDGVAQTLSADEDETVNQIKVALLSNDELKDYVNNVMHTTNLIMQCPICTIRTNKFTFKDTVGCCFQKLVTLTHGHGQRFEHCSEFVIYSEQACDVGLTSNAPKRYLDAANKQKC
ncbi:unnamed protein product [Bursaphelenchus okinawaensis]|uniref:Uncharacterized protein n=1 Tax=Bursaphelenchus okinawaensis TaxID=465554 RepID=A0A811JVA9_9BILA|nr:unnamed protein product [Bursaphelenchus okinawaensis]CAG9085619.1 unnamed protein product [Bursaphelenchus okinawaensis]